MRKKLFNVLSCFIFLALLLWVLVSVSRIVERKATVNYYKPFFEEKTGFDVLFFGNSHVACDISPMDLWNDYGITSYNFGNSSEATPITYWTMEMAFEHNKPQIAVIDISGCTMDSIKSAHSSWDCFPLSITKVKAVNDLIEDKNLGSSSACMK